MPRKVEELPIDLGWIGKVAKVNPEIILITAGTIAIASGAKKPISVNRCR